MPTQMSCVSMDEEPKLMNGSGMPVMGMMPMHMPTFSRTWKVQSAAHPTRTSLPKGASMRMASRMVAKIIQAKRPRSTTQPTKPNCSAYRAKTKSV